MPLYFKVTRGGYSVNELWLGDSKSVFSFPLLVTLIDACTGIGFRGIALAAAEKLSSLWISTRLVSKTSDLWPHDPDIQATFGFLSWMPQKRLRLQSYSLVRVQKPGRSQHRIWEKGCLSSSSALGLCLASTKMQRMKSRAWSEVCSGSSGLVGWVAILNIAAMASYSAHGGFSVNISTTVQPRLLRKTCMNASLQSNLQMSHIASWKANVLLCLSYSTLRLWRNVLNGNFYSRCLQRASSTCLGGSSPPGSITPLQRGLRTWNIPNPVTTCLTGLQPVTSLAWWVTTQSVRTRECFLLNVWECGRSRVMYSRLWLWWSYFLLRA